MPRSSRARTSAPPPRVCVAIAVVMGAWASAGGARAETLHRFAVVAGNDHGGSDTRPLVYATIDAQKTYDVLVQLGGVQRDDAVLLLDQSAGDLLNAVAAMDARARAAAARGEDTALVVYYSGHAKDGDLRLGNTRLGLEALRARVAQSPAGVRLAIVDSCRSGAITRTKGARRAPAFDIEASGAATAHGLVFLTSSSFDEDAQESDSIGGSYFSHHFVNGLRGDADRSGDGRVTLSEAYAYAYAHTVADTAESSAGAQHPTFSYDLKGNGDLVLAEYASQREGLYVPANAPDGAYFLVDRRGTIAAEVAKEPGRDRRIAMRSGLYKVKRRLPDRLRIGEIEIPEGRLVTLDEGRLHDAPFSDDPVKGASLDVGVRYSMNGGAIAQTFLDQATRSGLFPQSGMLALGLNIEDFFRHGWVVGFDLGGGSTRAVLPNDLGGLPFKFSEFGLGAQLVREGRFQDDRLMPFFGVRVAFVTMRRQFDDPTLPAQNFSTFSPGLTGGLRWRFGDHVGLLAQLRLHYLLYNVDDHRSLGYSELGAAVAYDF